MRRLVPGKATDEIIGRPGGATSSGADSGPVGLFSNRHDGGVAVSVESVESPEDRNYRVISFAENGDVTLLPVSDLKGANGCLSSRGKSEGVIASPGRRR